MARCLVALGSNLGERRRHLDRAVELLGFMPGVHVLDVSRYRETKPIGGPTGSPAYLNGVCLVETDLGPHDLLCLLQAVEGSLSRQRQVRWGPRTVDLDLLLHGETVLDTDCLTLPHPRMATRRFVLEPAAEIAADLRHPLADCTMRELLDNISHPRPYVAVTGVPGVGVEEVAAAVADRTLSRLVRKPTPLPDASHADAASPETWAATFDAWSAAIDEAAAVIGSADADGHHGIVSDYWLGSLSAECPLTPKRPRSRCPQVVLMCVAEGGRLTEPLAAMQARLLHALRQPQGGLNAERPKAVVRIPADDPARSIDEAVAAVEAMG